jgi:hypothetical protein
MTNQITTDKTGRVSSIAWTALVLSIISLIFAYVAFSRVGQIDNGGTGAEQTSLKVMESRQRLRSIKSNLINEPNINECQSELQDIRSELQQIYSNGSSEARKTWKQMQLTFDEAEMHLNQDQPSQAAEQIDAIIDLTLKR